MGGVSCKLLSDYSMQSKCKQDHGGGLTDSRFGAEALGSAWGLWAATQMQEVKNLQLSISTCKARVII